MICSDSFKYVNVSFYDNVKFPKRLDMPVLRVLNGIKNCAYRNIVMEARALLNNNDVDGYNRCKSCLPAVTFCGTFDKGHKANECTHYNNLLVIDIDKLDCMEMGRIQEILKQDQYIAAFWMSPSGRGFKGLVHLDYDSNLSFSNIMDKHRFAFKQLFTYLFSTYAIELDRSGSDISRLCYMSADANILIKEEAMPFHIEQQTLIKLEVNNKNKKEKNITTIDNVENGDWNEIYGKAIGYKYNKSNKNKLLYILKKLKKYNQSITDTWENWVKVAFSIASSVHPEPGRKLFLNFCELDGLKNNVVKSEHLILDAYRKNQGKCNINTIIYLARQKGVVLDG